MLKVTLGCLLLVCHVTEATLTIGAFNIQRLSDNKVSNATVVKEIAQILTRFDIVSIEEVLHATAIQTVLDELNRIGGPYMMTLGAKTGRTSYKEYLAILYRSDKVTLRNAIQYPDDSDDFERDPYTALFHSTHTKMGDFALMGVHIKPSDAFDEMNAVVDAYTSASKSLGTTNFVITGDFNADCRYLTSTHYHTTDLWTDDRFYFLVNADADTTVSHNTNCAYDRFIATGGVRASVDPGSVLVYNFETSMHLSYDEAKQISDHYPIQMQLQ